MLRLNFVCCFAACFLLIQGVEGAGRASDVLQTSLSSDIRSTDPGVNRDANTDTVMMHVFEGLVAYKENGLPGPLLAKQVVISPDEKSYTFVLRSGVRFHNGEELMPEDVVWTWRRYLNPDTGWECLGEFDGSRGNKIESIEVTGPNAVTFTLNRKQPLFLTHMAATQCGGSAILHPSSVNPDGTWGGPISTGPYVLRNWERGRKIELEAFGDYVSLEGTRNGYTGAKLAYAKKVRFLIIRDAAARVAALAKGQLDVMPEVPAAQMIQIRRLNDVRLIFEPMLVNYLILIQSRDALLSDVRIRKALELSLDRPPIAELVTEGVGVPNPSMIPAASPFHSKKHARSYGHDSSQARILLEDAGYAGEAISLTTNRRYPAMYNQALLVQAVARNVGIRIKIEVLEWATQLERWKTGDYQLMSFGFSARTDPYLNYASILGNYERKRTKIWNNVEAISLHETSGQIADFDDRQNLFDQIHELMLQDVPVLVLYSLSDVNAVRSNIEGFKSWALGRSRLWGVRRIRDHNYVSNRK